MTKLKSVLSLTLAVGAAIAAPSSPYVDRVFGCGELDLIFTCVFLEDPQILTRKLISAFPVAFLHTIHS